MKNQHIEVGASQDVPETIVYSIAIAFLFAAASVALFGHRPSVRNRGKRPVTGGEGSGKNAHLVRPWRDGHF